MREGYIICNTSQGKGRSKSSLDSSFPLELRQYRFPLKVSYDAFIIMQNNAIFTHSYMYILYLHVQQ